MITIMEITMDKHTTHPLCQDAELHYYNYLQDGKDQIPEAISVHIDDCPNCQKEIQWLKETLKKSEQDASENTLATLHAAQMQLHCTLIDQPVRCSTIKSFLPILTIPEMAVRISTPVTAHIRACPECTRDLEALKQQDLSSEQLSILSSILSHKQSEDAGFTDVVTDTFFQETEDSSIAIRRIIDRPDSGIVTIFRTEESSDETENQPYHIEVIHDEPVQQTPSPAGSPKNPETQSPAAGSKRWWFKPIAVAAAGLVIAILLFQSPSVKATDIGQIYEALKNVQHVVMTHYEIDNPEPIQIIRISRSMGIKLFETNGELTLYDIKNRTKKIKTSPDADVQETKIDRETAQTVAKTMDVPWGLLPFNNTSELPDGAVWEKVQSDSEQIEIFNLFWKEKTLTGKDINYQWQCHLDPINKHPFKIEWWRKTQQDQDYKLTTFAEIAYPTNDQFNQDINNIGFSD